ncbi:MAG TPA: hypothetical protein VL121_21005 [Agriterribacter sp.]|nr:hypothetical protein [Agriterribacter sp.]
MNTVNIQVQAETINELFGTASADHFCESIEYFFKHSLNDAENLSEIAKHYFLITELKSFLKKLEKCSGFPFTLNETNG